MELLSTIVICATSSWVLHLALSIYESTSKTEKFENQEMDIVKILNLNHSKLIRMINGMSGTEFEFFLQRLLEKLGYRAYITKKSGDYGADLIVYKDGLKMVVQAKRYSKSVGIKAVQEASSAVKYYSANKALVITNSRFTQEARDLAASNDVELWDRAILFELIVFARQLNDEVSYS